MTIKGDSFGYDPAAITAEWSDGTICKVQKAKMTEFTCKNKRFTKEHQKDQTLKITVNGVEDKSLTINLLSEAKKGN